MKARLPALLAATILLAACEHEAQLTYNVQNNSGSAVTVMSANRNKTDTFRIAANAQGTIAVNGQGLNSVNKYQEAGTMLRDLSFISVHKENGISATTDFRQTSRWEYKEVERYIADYTLTILPADF